MIKADSERQRLRRGIELFNAGEFFEAHEVLEDAWRECAWGTLRRRHLQGLVQLAVAFHHESRGNLIGARSVLERGIRNLMGAEGSLSELDVERLRDLLTDWQAYLSGACKASASHAGPSRAGSGRSENVRPGLARSGRGDSGSRLARADDAAAVLRPELPHIARRRSETKSPAKIRKK